MQSDNDNKQLVTVPRAGADGVGRMDRTSRTLIPVDIIRDERLSGSMLGLLVWLLHRGRLNHGPSRLEDEVALRFGVQWGTADMHLRDLERLGYLVRLNDEDTERCHFIVFEDPNESANIDEYTAQIPRDEAFPPESK